MKKSGGIYIPRGINTQALDREIQWDFNPVKLSVGLLIQTALFSAFSFTNVHLANSAGGRPHLWW